MKIAPPDAERLKEVVLLGAADGMLFNSTFFPKTCRMESADFHREMDETLDNPHARFINFRVFRGGSKTSKLRMYAGRRIAYNTSKTILNICASEGHAVRTIKWLKVQIERNTLYAQTFNLSKGSTWQDTLIEIRHGVDGNSIWVAGFGINSSVRGVNIEDYRPDLILVDDALTDENVTSEEQREKFINLLLGAVKESLTPETENPDAKLVMLQTPLHGKDASSEAMRDPQWVTKIFSCWTPETADKPLEERKSSWETRYPTATLYKEASAAIQMGRYSIFAREKECRLITSERAKFKMDTLKYWDDPGMPPLKHGTIVISVDPVPPPSPAQIANNLADKDWEAVSVTMREGGNYYLLGYEQYKGHEPIRTAQTVLKYIRLYKPLRVVVEAVAYQRVLANIIRNHLVRNQVYIEVKPLDDKRSKYNRIIGAIMDIAAAGKFYVSRAHLDFIADYSTYPSVDHDDLLDSVSMGLAELTNPFLEGTTQDFWAGGQQDEFTRKLHIQRGVP
jgi:phage terminase large subunit-like protein